MPGDEYELGNVVGKISFDLPEREMRKLDAADKGMKSLGGSDMDRGVKKKVDDVAKKAPVLEKTFKAFSKGGAAIAAAFGTVALLFGAGNGFRAFFGALGDMLTVLSDLLFMQVWPLLKPLLEWMVEGLGKVAAFLAAPGTFWEKIGTVGDVIIGAVEGALKWLADPESWKKLGEVGLKLFNGTWEFLVKLLGNPETWKNLMDTIFNLIGTTIKVVGGFLLNPDTWIGLGQILWAFVSGIGTSIAEHVGALIAAGANLAADFVKGIADRVVDLVDSARQMAQAFIDAVAEFFMNNPVTKAIVNAGGAVGNAGSWVGNQAQNAWGGVTNAWSGAWG